MVKRISLCYTSGGAWGLKLVTDKAVFFLGTSDLLSPFLDLDPLLPKDLSLPLL